MGGKFYIYEHWRPDRDECFYVGKGFGRRANDMQHRSRLHKAIQKKLAAEGSAVEVYIIFRGLDEQAALDREIERIAFWRADGADLVNQTDGGEGMAGYRHSADAKERIRASKFGNKVWVGRKHTTEAIEKTRQKQIGIPKSEATKAKMRKPKNEAHKEKLRQANLGKKHSPETRAKLSASATIGWANRRANLLMEK